MSPESLEGNVWDDLSRIEKEEKAQHSLRRTTTRTTPAARYLRTFFPGRAVHWPNGQETAIFYCPNVQGPIGRSLPAPPLAVVPKVFSLKTLEAPKELGLAKANVRLCPEEQEQGAS